MPPQASSASAPSTKGKATRSQEFGRSRDGQAIRGKPQRCSMAPGQGLRRLATSNPQPVRRRGGNAAPDDGRIDFAAERSAGLRRAAKVPLSRGGGAGAMEAVLTLLDLERLRASPLRCDPFDHVIVENFLRAEHTPSLVADFPPLGGHGSFPLAVQACGAAFARLAAELEGDDLRRAIEEKFALD